MKPLLLQDPDNADDIQSISGPDATDITVAMLSGELLHEMDEAIANSPPLHSRLTS